MSDHIGLSRTESLGKMLALGGSVLGICLKSSRHYLLITEPHGARFVDYPEYDLELRLYNDDAFVYHLETILDCLLEPSLFHS